jgi:hypothetical protein
MRIIGIAVLSALMTSAGAAGDAWHPIDLNRPGALEQLKVERPRHYMAISEVLRAAERVPCKDHELETLSARFDVREMACNFLLMTSDPPKRHLSFELEGTRYVAVVTVKDTGGRVVHAKDAD